MINRWLKHTVKKLGVTQVKCRNKVQPNTAIYIYTGTCVGSSCQRRCSLLPLHFNTVFSTNGEHLSYNMYITTAPSLTMKWIHFDHAKRKKKKKKIQLCGILAELSLFWLVGVGVDLFLPITSQWEEYSVLSVRANFHTCMYFPFSNVQQSYNMFVFDKQLPSFLLLMNKQ